MIELTNNDPDLLGLPVAIAPSEVTSVACYAESSDGDEIEPAGTVIGLKNGSEFYVQEDYDDVMAQISL